MWESLFKVYPSNYESDLMFEKFKEKQFGGLKPTLYGKLYKNDVRCQMFKNT